MKYDSRITLRQKTLILFLAAGNEDKIDPIRIMKGLFLFAKKTPDDWLSTDARYEFVPYSYGPCSFQIYSDIDGLISRGLVSEEQIQDQSWKYYSVTDKGREIAQESRKEIHSDAVGFLERIREFVSSVSFRNLLAVIYREYPDYAVNSVFKF